MKIQLRSIVVSTLIAFSASACTSKLVLETDQTSGLPLPSAVPYVEFYAQDKHSKGAPCSATLGLRHLSLPGETKIFVNVEPETFAKTGLVVKYSERGTVSEVAFNTEPSSDGIEAATGAATSLLPFLGLLPAVRAPAPAVAVAPANLELREDAADNRVACDAGEVPLRLIPLATYLDAVQLTTIVAELRNYIKTL